MMLGKLHPSKTMTFCKFHIIRLALASVAVLIMTSSIASAQLMSLYQFNGNLNDTVRGNGAGSVLLGSASFTTNAIIGQALDLNGATLIRAPQAGAGLQAYTISAWVNFRSLGEWSTIVKNWGDMATGAFHFGLNDSDGVVSNYIGTTDGAPSVIALDDPISTDLWYHLAVTFGSGSQILYVNGAQVASAEATGTVLNNFPDMSFGGKLNDEQDGIAPVNPGWFDGWLDEVAFFNTNLTSTQIADIYSAGTNRQSVTTLGYSFQPYGPAAIPEPGTWAAAALLVGAAGYVRWRKRAGLKS